MWFGSSLGAGVESVDQDKSEPFEARGASIWMGSGSKGTSGIEELTIDIQGDARREWIARMKVARLSDSRLGDLWRETSCTGRVDGEGHYSCRVLPSRRRSASEDPGAHAV